MNPLQKYLILYSIYLCHIAICAAQQNNDFPPIGFKSLAQIEGDYEFYNARQFPGNDNTTLFTGSFTGTLVIDGDSLQGNETGTSFLALKDSLDQWLWAQVIEGNGHNQISNALQRDNGWIVTGVFSDSIMIGDVALINMEHTGIFVADINTEGDFTWASGYPVAPVGGQIFISRAPNNKFYLATGFNGEFEYNDSIYSSGFVNHLLFARFSENGTIEKVFQFQSKNDLELTFLQESVNGGVIMGGNFSDTIFHKRRFIANEGISDFFLVALDENFQVQMIKNSKGMGMKKLSGCIAHKEGFLFYGSYQGEFLMDSVEFLGEGYQNLFLMKMNRRGNIVWQQIIGGNSHKTFQAFAKGSQHEIYAMMNFRGELPLLDTVFETQTGAYRTVLMKINQTGNTQWVSSSDNVANFLARMNERSRDGKIEFVGISPGNPQVSLFNNVFENDDKGLFVMELFDCEYARRIQMEDTLQICGPGTIMAEEGFDSYLWNDTFPGRALDIENSAIVYLQTTDEFGCVMKDTTFVEVLPLPEITIAGNPMLCAENGSTLLIADGDYTFLWNNNTEGSFLVVAEPDYYEVTATNQWGCQSAAGIIVDIYAANEPQMDETYFISTHDTLAIYPGNYATYNWSDGSNAPLFHLAGGSFDEGLYEYSVELTDFNGCSYFIPFSVYVMNLTTYSAPANPPPVDESPITVMNDDLLTDEAIVTADFSGGCPFMLYPNPGDGLFNMILSPEWMEDTRKFLPEKPELHFFSGNGELVLKMKVETELNPTIDIREKAKPGLFYAVLLMQGRAVCVEKVMLIP